MSLNRLSARKVDTLKEPGPLRGRRRPLPHRDEERDQIVARSTTASKTSAAGRRALGSLAAVGLSAARDKAAHVRSLIAEGKDPMEHRDIPEDNPSFGQCATALIAELEPGWKNDKHKWQWRHTLETYAAAIWNRPVASITTTDIVDIIRPMWAEKRETAMRLRGRIEKVLDAAKVKGQRTGDNPRAGAATLSWSCRRKSAGRAPCATTRPCQRSKCRTSCPGSAPA
jgi:hypothetical protein